MQVKNYKPINKGALVGRFDLYIDTMKLTIRDCTYMQTANSEWVGYPSREYTDTATNTKKYFSFILFDNDIKESVQKKILPLLKKEKNVLSNNKEQISDELPF